MTNAVTLERRIVIMKRLLKRLFGIKPEDCTVQQFCKIHGLVERIMGER